MSRILQLRGLFLFVLLALVLSASCATAESADTKETSDAQEDTAQAWNAQHNVQQAFLSAEAGAFGDAVLHMERARYLRPFDLEIRQGLDLLRQRVQRDRMNRFRHVRLTQGEPDGLWWWRAFNVLPTRIWATFALFTLWLAFILWRVVRRMDSSVRKDAVGTTATLNLLVAVFAATCWLGAARTTQLLEPGVIIDAEPELFHAPDELSEPMRHPDLYEGAVVLIRNQSSAWTQIELAGRAKAWVLRESVSPIEPEQSQR